MTTEHQTTPEEEALERLLNENWETLSEMARTVFTEAEAAAYGAHLVHNYCFQWDGEYDEALEKMRLAAAELTDHDHQLLATIWRAALAAAASVDADDLETLAGYRVYSGDLHYCYRMISRMIERTLQDKKVDEAQKKIAKREPVDDSDLPF
jgi:hypothetical protein